MLPLAAHGVNIYAPKRDEKVVQRTLITQNVHEIIVSFGACQNDIGIGLF
jgi:hypothetical protein